MIVIAGVAHLKPGTQAAVEALITEVMALTRAEDGCLSYTMYPVHGDRLFVFEEWASAEALERHLAAAHTTSFLEKVTAHLAQPPALQRYEVTSKKPLFS